MRFRRLGRTELMVSEVGLSGDRLRGLDAAAAEADLRAALDAGVTLIAWHVADALDDIEPLIARVAGSDRGRLTLVAIFDRLPPPEEIGPQVEAVGARLGNGGAVDVAVFPELPDAAACTAIEGARERGSVRFAGYDGAAAPLSGGVDVLLTRVVDGDLGDIGVIVRVESDGELTTALDGRVACVIVDNATATRD